MLAQAQVEASALIETVVEMKSSSAHEEFAALRQQLAELQRAHDEDLQAISAVRMSAAAEQQDAEPVKSQTWKSQQQQEAAHADHDEHSALAAAQMTADAITELRARLNKLADHVPAVQRLRTSRVPTASKVGRARADTSLLRSVLDAEQCLQTRAK